MAIKILIKRHFEEDSTHQAFALIKNFRQDAMNRSGDIAGETWINHYDPCQITVLSTWQTVEDWIQWEESDERAAHEEKLKDILIIPAQFEIYDVVGVADTVLVGHADDETPAGRDERPGLVEHPRTDVVRNVLEHFRQHDRVVGLVRG